MMWQCDQLRVCIIMKASRDRHTAMKEVSKSNKSKVSDVYTAIRYAFCLAMYS